jgi:hypothetical protein
VFHGVMANHGIDAISGQWNLVGYGSNILKAIAIPTQFRRIENDIDSNDLASTGSVVKASIATAKVQSRL